MDGRRVQRGEQRDVQESSTVSRFLEALNTHETNRIRDVLTPDFVFEEVAGEGEPSLKAFLDELGMVLTAFPDIAFRPVRQTRQAERVYVEFRAIGTHQRQFLDVKPTNGMAIISGVFNLEQNGNGIRRLRMTVDFGGLRRQLLLAGRTSQADTLA